MGPRIKPPLHPVVDLAGPTLLRPHSFLPPHGTENRSNDSYFRTQTNRLHARLFHSFTDYIRSRSKNSSNSLYHSQKGHGQPGYVSWTVSPLPCPRTPPGPRVLLDGDVGTPSDQLGVISGTPVTSVPDPPTSARRTTTRRTGHLPCRRATGTTRVTTTSSTTDHGTTYLDSSGR